MNFVTIKGFMIFEDEEFVRCDVVQKHKETSPITEGMFYKMIRDYGWIAA